MKYETKQFAGRINSKNLDKLQRVANQKYNGNLTKAMDEAVALFVNKQHPLNKILDTVENTNKLVIQMFHFEEEKGKKKNGK